MLYYHLSLERATGISHAISGDYTGEGLQQIAVSSGNSLSLWSISNGRISKELQVDVFGVICSMSRFRAKTIPKDYIIIGTDSGKLIILEYNKDKNDFTKVFQKMVGRAGCCRATTGQHLAVDRNGRAFMIGALENTKHAYKLSSKIDQPVSISEPVSASTEGTLIYHMVAVDTGFGNPIFACLEANYMPLFPGETSDSIPTQWLVFYELDVECKAIHREALVDRGNFLISVPGDSSVLICATNCITYVKRKCSSIRCPIPMRITEITGREMIFVCSATCEKDAQLFFLAQTEQGDIFIITLEKENGVVNEIRLRYFDTVPVASALCILNSGHLFVASEFGNHYLYEIKDLEDNEPEFSSLLRIKRGSTFFFMPRPSLKYLVLADEVKSLSPIMHLETNPLSIKNPHLLLACGRGQSSTLRVLDLKSKNFKERDKTLIELEFTPRKFVYIPKNSKIIVIETDHNSCTSDTAKIKKEKFQREIAKADKRNCKMLPKKTKEKLKMASDASSLCLDKLGVEKPKLLPNESGMWASVIRTLDLINNKMLAWVLGKNKAAFSICLVKVASEVDQEYLLVGFAKDLQLGTGDSAIGGMYFFKVGEKLELLQTIDFEKVPTALCQFQESVLIGIGGTLRMYDFVKERLFVKYEKKVDLCNQIVSIHTVGQHIIVGDIQEGFFYFLYQPETNKIKLLSKDDSPSWVTASCLLDDDKMARADKFGNISIVRLPFRRSEKYVYNVCNEILPHPRKVEILATFHVGEMVSSLQQGILSKKKPKVLVYTTLSGSIGYLAPLQLEEIDENFLLHLEMLMRAENPQLCGRDHLSYRSYYYPMENVIDGDLCELFHSLNHFKQIRIADMFLESAKQPLLELCKMTSKISEQLRDLRRRYEFRTNHILSSKTK